MNAMLDTLSITRRLRGAGFSQEQVDAIAEAVRDAASLPDISNLTTKDDLRNGLEVQRAELRAAITDSKAETLKWSRVIKEAGVRGD